MTSSIPVIMTTAGAQPTPPVTLNADLIANVAALVPGYTANLPGSMIEDLSSTATGGLYQIDQARIDAINSISPFGANLFVLNQIAACAGIPTQGTVNNTSVYVVFTGSNGYIIPKGFTVSDGTYNYVIQDGGVIQTGGVSLPLYALANVSGSWAVNANTVTEIKSSLPLGITLTVTNPTAGTPGGSAESNQAFRARALQAFALANSQGAVTFLKSLLTSLPNVQARLVSVHQTSAEWEVICGGGDPYQIAYAVFKALFYIPGLVGSTIQVTGISVATNAVVTTNLNHGLTTGQLGVQINGITGTMASIINGQTLTITVLTPTTFEIGINTTGDTYISGGIVTPNSRNISVSLYDYPDTYVIPIVNPPVQAVTIVATWNTISTNLVSPAAVAQLASPAIQNYINSIVVGKPINILELEFVFQQAVVSLIPTTLLSRLLFSVTINGVSASVVSGTEIILSDPESYFYITSTGISVNQG